MIKCEDCGKDFKSTQALGGHMRFVHGVRKDSQAPLFPPKRFITDENLIDALAASTATLRREIYEAVGQVLYELWSKDQDAEGKKRAMTVANEWVKKSLAEKR